MKVALSLPDLTNKMELLMIIKINCYLSEIQI